MLVRAALCLALFFRTEALITVENNAYKNVVVSFSSRFSPDDGNHLKQSMEQILDDASSVLQIAVGLSLGKVTFHVPRTWNVSALPNIRYISSYNADVDPDIRVTSLADSAFGGKPIALQYGGCGVPALEISIPKDFLMIEEESYPKGKVLAREFLKYRYGVFDENGFLDDPLYPTHFSIPGKDEILITDCTFPKLSYSLRDSENNSCVLTSETAANCSIQPNDENLENVKSSLMFYHEDLHQLSHVCGKDERIHNVVSLNKQNLLCSYKSIWEVLESSEDFKSKQSLSVKANEKIEYLYVQESELRLFVAWQDTKHLLTQGPTVLNVVRKLLYDIPDSSKVALYNFKGDTVKELQPFEEITDTVRKSWMPRSNFGSSEEGKPMIAVGKAVEILKADSDDKPGIIVLFTASNPSENPDLIEKLKDSTLCLTVIGFNGATKNAWSAFLDVSTCSSFLEVPNSDDSDLEVPNSDVTYKNLYNAIQPIIQTSVEDSKTYTVSTQLLPFNGNVEIPADPRAERFIVWIFLDADLECLVNETAVNLKREADSAGLVSYSFEAQNDTVKCNLKDLAYGSHLVQIQMTTKEGEYLNNKVWFQDTTPIQSNLDSTEQMPYIIFAKIFYGEYPVRDADVRAEITTPSGRHVNLTLVDDGRGDPDITQNDGIYSKYFINFDSVGTYHVKVIAKDNGRATTTKNGQNLCCGSIVVGDTFPMEEFNWAHETSFDIVLKKPEKGYKPSRISDLRVESLDLPSSLTLKWTAPGGEMDEGKASNYEFLMFCQHQDCHNNGILPKWISFSSTIKPKDSGKEEAVRVQFNKIKPENITIYLALKALNKNQTGQVSNRVYIQLIPYDLPETTTPETTKDNTKSESPSPGSIVAYVIISIAILMLIIGVGYYQLDRTKRSRALDELETPADLTSTESSGNIFSFKSVAPPHDNPIRQAESIPVVLYTHNQIKDFKDKTKQPPLYRLDRAPKPWSSLNALIDGNGSSGSSSTVNVGDIKTQSCEIRPLDDVSFKVPLQEKKSRF